MFRPPAISIGWGEGRYLDLWMLVHFLTGVVGGLSNVFFGMSAAVVYAIGTAMMVAWEAGEYAAGIRESMSNRVIDVVVGLAGVWLALWAAARLDQRGEVVLLVAVSATALILMSLGIRAYKARKKRRAKATA